MKQLSPSVEIQMTYKVGAWRLSETFQKHFNIGFIQDSMYRMHTLFGSLSSHWFIKASVDDRPRNYNQTARCPP